MLISVPRTSQLHVIWGALFMTSLEQEVHRFHLWTMMTRQIGSINNNLDDRASHLKYDLKIVNIPPDPFSRASSPDFLQAVDRRMRQITARGPLEDIMSYLKHPRS
jgi:hypothetical protein